MANQEKPSELQGIIEKNKGDKKNLAKSISQLIKQSFPKNRQTEAAV